MSETTTKYSVRTDKNEVLYNTIDEAKKQAVFNKMQKATAELLHHEQDPQNGEWWTSITVEKITKSCLEDLLFQIEEAEKTDVIEWNSEY
jgi:hypothetical protein